ncbi:MAG TPA: ATP-binding protein [Acidimicrobiales bacterium]|nr:ATP-binding protein [Acidimicrobiales bacterium]
MRSEVGSDADRVVDPVGAVARVMRKGGAVAIVAAAGAVALAWRHLAGVPVDPRGLGIVAASMAAALMCALTLVSFLWWRVAGDRRALLVSTACFCYATFPLVLGVVAPAVTGAPELRESAVAFQLAGVPAIAAFGLAARRTGEPVLRTARATLGALLLATVSVAALLSTLPLTGAADLGFASAAPARPGARVAMAALAGSWAIVALAHIVAARRGARRLIRVWSVAAAGIGLAYGVGAVPGAWSAGAAWLVMAGALVAGLWGATVELQRHHAAERRDLGDALVQAARARSHAQAVDESRAELRHDARAALLGIEAAGLGLSRHRDLLTGAQWEELSRGLVAEVHRLGDLLDERTDDGSAFDVRDAVMPVITCARADGQAIRVAVPAGIVVHGSRDRTAHALQALLHNARRHAQGALVDVQVVAGEGDATLVVADRGPGVPPELQGSLFERGARGPTSAGSGLGLFVARRLVTEAGGALWFEPRPGGGSTFAVRLPLAVPARTLAPVAGPPASGAPVPARPASGAPVPESVTPSPAARLDATPELSVAG